MIPRTDVSVSAKGKRVTGTAGTANSTTNRARADGMGTIARKPAAAPPALYAHGDVVAPTAGKMRLGEMPPKTVALLGAVCLTTGWLLASMLTPPVAKLQSLPQSRTRRPS